MPAGRIRCVTAQPNEHGSPTAQVEAEGMCSYLVDLWVSDAALLRSESRLSGLLRSIAESGTARVIGETSHTFPNGGVTSVLLLSKSHLSIHTWPEFDLANIDLLTYGQEAADRMLQKMESAFSPVRMNVSRVLRPAR